MNKSLLIIGKPYSSKTVFITQFYIRLIRKKSRLVLKEAIENLSFISASKIKLSQGELPISTPTEQNEKIVLPVSFDNQVVNIECPDYGGEQINKIIAERELDENWSGAIAKSDNWILFIRITSINKSNDISNAILPKEKLVDGADTEKSESKYTSELSDQSAFIELLQILLDAKNNNLLVKNKTIKLTIALTCWDELKTKELPETLLKKHFPLLFDFIESIWIKDNIKIIGLSALECDLRMPENKEKYEVDGPESFGYIVNANGLISKDITELVFEAL